MLSLGFQD